MNRFPSSLALIALVALLPAALVGQDAAPAAPAAAVQAEPTIAPDDTAALDTPPQVPDAPAVPLVAPLQPVATRFEHTVLLDSATDALHSGLPQIARNIYAELLPVVREEDHEEVVRGLAAAQLAVGAAGDAAATLDAHPAPEASWWLLLRSLAALETGDDARVTELLAGLEVDELDAPLQPWLQLARGVIASHSGDSARATAHYQRAIEMAPVALKSHVELLLLRDQLENGKASDAVVADLRRRMRDMQGQRGGFEAARLLAIALHQTGRSAEAASILEEQLRYIGSREGNLREELQLLLGGIAGADSARGRMALTQLLSNATAPRKLLENALAMLSSAAGSDEGHRSFLQTLDVVIREAPQHPLMDQLLLLRANHLTRDGLFDAAVADAQLLIDRYPASSLRMAAYRTLVFCSWKRTPAQFRTAASYLERMRAELPDGPERARLGVMMADSFFLNRDYANAAAAYADTLDEPVDDPSLVFYQRVLSELRARHINAAREALDALQPDSFVNAEQRWRAEWNLVHAMRTQGDSQGAFARLQSLLLQGVAAAPPPSLRLRLMWLEAQLSIDAGQPARTPERCDEIMEALHAVPADVLGDKQRETISSHTLLLKAQAHLLLGEEEAAVTTLKDLRSRHPDSEAAHHSYLVEARYYAEHDRLVEAQRLLLELADTYPDTPQAPVALWEAALAAEQRGLDASLREALTLLDRLVAQFPQHFLVFHARLRQGDVLRRLNDFNTALLVYEDLINRFPDHPQIYLAWLSRADCYQAQAGQNPARRGDAVAIYERLMERRDVPGDFRAEAAFKWAYGLDRNGQPRRAEDAYWMTLSRFTGAEEGTLLGARGRYWVSRAAVELGQMLENRQQYEEARAVYQLMLDTNLPGRALAQGRIKRLSEPRL